jgi:mycofactocin precursor peptide peptidase
MSRHLAFATSPELPSGATVLVPVGSLEQHGPHLPLHTDSVVAEAVARRAAELLDRPDVLVAPPIAYGASGEHQAFAGTSSIGTEALRLVVVELTRSLRTWAARVVYVNGHGGNVGALDAAVEQLVAERHDVCWLACAAVGGDAHAGYTETALMLHLRPADVRRDRAEAGNPAPLEQLLPAMVADGVHAVAANGVLGNPTGASAERGQRVLEEMARRVAAGVRRRQPPVGGGVR